MKSLLLAAALALSAPAGQPVPAARETAPAVNPVVNADPALWVVRDEDTTIYLFGTFHLLDDRAWLNDEVKIAFDESRELVLEAIIPDDPAAIQPMILRYAVDTRGRRLSQRLNEQQNATLSEALAGLGVPADAFERLEPWFVSMTLATVAGQRLGISAAQGPETILLEAARERDMTVAELEGLEWQIRLFDEMPDEQQIAQLRHALDSFDNLSESLAPMLAAWSTGDVEGLERIIEAERVEDPAMHALLFTSRNRAWAEWIAQRLDRPGTVFVAVGAGHLAGGDSVQAALLARGINSGRVEPAAKSRDADGF